jgi:hypothetical protein
VDPDGREAPSAPGRGAGRGAGGPVVKPSTFGHSLQLLPKGLFKPLCYLATCRKPAEFRGIYFYNREHRTCRHSKLLCRKHAEAFAAAYKLKLPQAKAVSP